MICIECASKECKDTCCARARLEGRENADLRSPPSVHNPSPFGPLLPPSVVRNTRDETRGTSSIDGRILHGMARILSLPTSHDRPFLSHHPSGNSNSLDLECVVGGGGGAGMALERTNATFTVAAAAAAIS